LAGRAAEDVQQQDSGAERSKKAATDFVLIDGRFMVACCLEVFNSVGSECFDDFTDRESYHVVLEYFDIVHEVYDRMVILKKKPGMREVPQEVL